jgi:arsenate reductase
MKFQFSKSKSHTKAVLFVCVENSARSQMAVGFFRKYAPYDFKPVSAGTKPSTEINPLAVQVMDEIGIDISKQKPKEITKDMMLNSVKIVNMECMDKSSSSFCPTLFLNNLIDWNIEDHKDKPIEKVREIRKRFYNTTRS